MAARPDPLDGRPVAADRPPSAYLPELMNEGILKLLPGPVDRRVGGLSEVTGVAGLCFGFT